MQDKLNRREFLKKASMATVAGTTGFLVGCNTGQPTVESAPATSAPAATEEAAAESAPATSAPAATAEEIAEAAQDTSLPELEWQMATSWPVALDTIFGGAQVFAERVAALTSGKFQITPRAAGEIAPGLEVLNVVEQGAVQCGHTASYYYVGKSPITAFGTALPFGLTAQQNNAWLYEGGGLAMLQELYASKFGVIQFPAGNTGAQMGGWFRKEISTLADLQGLKMRIPGLGGQVMTKLGVTVQTLPGGEIFQALQTGAIDAAEWVGPYDDEKLGLQKATGFYYYPGWWEPGPTLEVQVNLQEYEKLPDVYKAAIQTAAFEANLTMLARYDGRNNEALQRLLGEGVKLTPYSEEIMSAAEEAAFGLYDELAAQDADFKAVFDEWSTFRERVYAWN
ncbi:MAG TPA: twin-arginine translocation signal domain-containing protein, partial [Anaerolineae bacterium]|nr:twin-arginine translocation signal domain-containing protein [Anaerolineae bacterium]